MRSMQGCTDAHFSHCSTQTMFTEQSTHFSQLVVPSQGDGSPDELLELDVDDPLELDVDELLPPWPAPPEPPLPESTTTFPPQPGAQAQEMVRAPMNNGKVSFGIAASILGVTMLCEQAAEFDGLVALPDRTPCS